MKKFYASPEFEVTVLLTEDILDGSLEENEVEIDGGDLW